MSSLLTETEKNFLGQNLWPFKMSVPERNSSVTINGVWYKVTKSPAEGFWVEPEKDQWSLLVFIDDRWFVYEYINFNVEDKTNRGYINVKKVYYSGDLVNIDGQEYLISEQLTGFHIDFGEPNYIISDGSVFMATREVEVNQVKKETSSKLSGIPEQILLENMDLEQAKTYCHNFPSDNCNQTLVKKIYGPDVINRRPKGMEVNKWITNLLTFDPTSIKDIIGEIYKNMSEMENNINLFMVLVDWCIKNKPNFEQLKLRLDRAINVGLIDKVTPEFVRWLVDRGLNPETINIQHLLELYLKGEQQEEVIETLEYLLSRQINIEVLMLGYIGLPEFGEEEEEKKEIPSLDLRILTLLDRFGFFSRYRSPTMLTDEYTSLFKNKKFTEVDFLIQKGYTFPDKFINKFYDMFDSIRMNFYEWVNTRNFRLSDQQKRLFIQNAIRIEKKEEAVRLLEFIKSQELPENVIVFSISAQASPWDTRIRTYIPQGIVENWFIQNGIRWDPTQSIKM